jgi:diaminopimelate epimerase
MIPGKKFHAYGNDFLIVESRHLSEEDLDSFSETVCRRHFGVGADGCVILNRLSEKEFNIRIFNRDGSEAGMSGNGARCAAAYVHQLGLASSDEVSFQTISGEKRYRLLEMQSPNWKYVSAIGVPGFEPKNIPVEPSEGLRKGHEYSLSVAGTEFSITPLSVGNPQCVMFVTALPRPDEFARLGRALESHPFFPERTNVSFVEVLDRHKVRIKIWERGVGPTHSSGTGSSGAGVAAIYSGKAFSPVEVSTETGIQIVTWRPSEQVMLTGEATFIADFNFHWEGSQVLSG